MKGGLHDTLTNQPNDICNNYVVEGFQWATHSTWGILEGDVINTSSISEAHKFTDRKLYPDVN